MLISTALCFLVLAPAKEFRILFMGNSHTATHDVPGMVSQLIDGPNKKIKVRTMFAGFLNDMDNEPTRNLIKTGKWNVVVFQAAKVSSSHNYKYDQTGGINLAKLARSSGAKTYWFVEWPRRGWNESDLQMEVYRGISKAAGGKLVPICYAWDEAIRQKLDFDLWAQDGNHSALGGAYLAACTLAYYIAGGADPTYVPPTLDRALAKKLRSIAERTWRTRK